MPRKRKETGAIAVAVDNEVQPSSGTDSTASGRPAYIDGPPVTPEGEIIQADQAADNVSNGQEKNWGPPYKAIFKNTAKGFEMGENRRYRQRVFIFNEKPSLDILTALKDNGFTYRPAEKAWTIQANAATRELSDQLAREFAGESQEISR